MDALVRTYNDLLDLATEACTRLLELPVFVLLGLALLVLLLPAAGRFIFLRLRGRKPSASGKSRYLVVAYVFLALLIIFDRKFQMVLHEVRAIRAELRTRPTVRSSVGGSGPLRLLFDKGRFERGLREVFKDFELRVEPESTAVDHLAVTVREPVLARFHVAVVDLTRPGLEVCITEKQGEKWLTSDFARKHGCVVAINGEAGLSPARNSGFGHWVGNWICRGEPIMLEDTADRPFLSFDRGNRARYFEASVVDRTVTAEKYNTIWGRHDILVRGEVVTRDTRREPRTCMGVSARGDKVVLIVVDGRRPGHSIGLGLVTVARVMRLLDVCDAMSCDQGGSSCMYLKSRDGIVGVPSDGKERGTYTHFGIAER